MIISFEERKKKSFHAQLQMSDVFRVESLTFFSEQARFPPGTYGAPPLLHCTHWYWSDDIFTGLAHWSNTVVSHLLRILNSLTLFCVNPLANFKLAI